MDTHHKNSTMKPFLMFLILCAIACSKNSDNPEPDQYGGKDLYNELSQQEKTLIGTWYFAHEIFKLKNGHDSISIKSKINYGSMKETDTLHFFSTQFVGHRQYSPLVAPDSLKHILKTCNSFTLYLQSFGPEYISGWFILNNILINFSGDYGPTYPPVMDYLPIEKLNNDSLVFVYQNEPFAKYDKRKTVFYKK